MASASEQDENMENFMESEVARRQEVRLEPINDTADRVQKAAGNEQP